MLAQLCVCQQVNNISPLPNSPTEFTPCWSNTDDMTGLLLALTPVHVLSLLPFSSPLTLYIYVFFFIAYGLSSVGLESQMSTALLVNTISYAANHKPFKHHYRKLQSLFSYSWSKPIYQTHNDALKQYLYIALSYTNCCILFVK